MTGIKYCKKCNSSMWPGTDRPANIRKGMCDYCTDKDGTIKVIEVDL